MNFNSVSGFYDSLASLIFGSKWNEVQFSSTAYLSETDKNILIVGGGTGRLLGRLEKKQITFLELSSKMIQHAQNVESESLVQFLEGDYLTWQTKEKYDVVIFPFFLDCFDELHLKKLLQKAKGEINPNGKLIVTDFQPSHWLHDLLVKVMYVFFGITTGLKARKLLDIRSQINNAGFEEKEVKEFYQGWIFSGEYVPRKPA